MLRGADAVKYGATEHEPGVTEEGGVCEGQETSPIYLLVGFLCFAGLAEGYDIGVINGAIVQIREHFDFNSSQVGMVVAIMPLSAIVGALLHGALADHFGRRLGLVSVVMFLFSGPLVSALATGITALLIGRSLAGIGMGGGMLVVTIYISELAPESERGRLVACQELAINLGIVLGYCMGWLLLGVHDDWRWMLGIGSFLHLSLMVALLVVYLSGASDSAFLPETSRWLAKKGRFDSAYQVLEKYNGKSAATIKMKELHEECQREEDQEFISWQNILCAWRNTPLLHMLLTGILVAVSETICGGTSVAIYSSTIMEEHLGKADAFFATVVMGCLRLCGVTIGILAIDRAGRRPLLLASASVMATSCIFVGVVVHLELHVARLLPAGMWVMMLGFTLGLGTVPLPYISEIFPTRIRQKGITICMFWCRLGGSSCAMAYPLLLEHYGIAQTFVLQGVINFVLLTLLWFMVHETKGLSLEQSYKLFHK